MSSRDLFLSKIRKHSYARVELPSIHSDEKSNMDLVSLFIERFEQNGGEVVRLESGDALRNWVHSYAVQWDISAVLLSDELKLEFETLPIYFNSSTDGLSTLVQRDSTIGIDRAVYGIAQSGAVCIAETDTIHWSSIIPAHHLVILSEGNIVADLVSCMAVLPKEETFTLIAGPSKTADIEKTLITGVHGPGRITVVLLRH